MRRIVYLLEQIKYCNKYHDEGFAAFCHTSKITKSGNVVNGMLIMMPVTHCAEFQHLRARYDRFAPENRPQTPETPLNIGDEFIFVAYLHASSDKYASLALLELLANSELRNVGKLKRPLMAKWRRAVFTSEGNRKQSTGNCCLSLFNWRQKRPLRSNNLRLNYPLMNTSFRARFLTLYCPEHTTNLCLLIYIVIVMGLRGFQLGHLEKNSYVTRNTTGLKKKVI